MDPDTEAESVLTNDRGKPCTLTLPCTVDGLAAISAVCPPAVPPSQVPNECPAACSEIVDPWYTECNAMSPESVLAIDTQMNGEFVRFAELCDPRLQAPVIPPPPPNGVVGGESGRQCTDEIDNDGDGSMDCDDPDCATYRRCAYAGYGSPCQGVSPPRRERGGRGQPPPPPSAVIGIRTDPATGLESALINDHGKACTLTLPCTVEGLAAISAVCPPAVPPAQVPNACPAACSELIDPWYTECLALSPDGLAAIDTEMNGEFSTFVLTCNPAGWGH